MESIPCTLMVPCYGCIKADDSHPEVLPKSTMLPYDGAYMDRTATSVLFGPSGGDAVYTDRMPGVDIDMMTCM